MSPRKRPRRVVEDGERGGRSRLAPQPAAVGEGYVRYSKAQTGVFPLPKPRLVLEILMTVCLVAISVSCVRQAKPDWAAAQSANPLHTPLSGKRCDLFEDKQGITHIKAEDELGLYACWGYVHGRDRAFQVEFFRARPLERDPRRGFSD